MSMTIDDPRLTAYALGDCDDSDRAVVEAALNEQPELRREVEAIRLLGAEVGNVLGREEAPSLHKHQRDAVTQASLPTPIRFPRWLPIIAAAALLFAAGWIIRGFGVQQQALEQRDRNADERLSLHTTVLSQDREEADSVSESGGTSAWEETRPIIARRVDKPANVDDVTTKTVDEAGAVALPNIDDSEVIAKMREEPEASASASASVKPAGQPGVMGGWADGLPHADRQAKQPVTAGEGSSPADSAQVVFERPTITEGQPLKQIERESERTYEATSAGSPGRMGAGGNNREQGQQSGTARQDSRDRVWAEGAKLKRPADPQEPASDRADLSGQDAFAGNLGRLGFREVPEPVGGLEYKAYGLQHNHFTLVRSPGGDASTFSLDVDSASYAQVRDSIRNGRRPDPATVRIEELVNAFDYEYQAPSSGPFAVHAEWASCPWNERHRLVRLAVKGKEIPRHQRPASNLVFLIDVSGSMSRRNKLPLLKQSMRELVQALDGRDRVGIVVYSSNARIVLDSTSANDQGRILAAIDSLSAGGSTNGEGGIRQAYQVARQHFIQGGTNRVLMATDGDFNVGISDEDELVRLIKGEASTGVELTVLGFGAGNARDDKMEALSNHGQGNYHFIDNQAEGRRVLVDQLSGTLVTIAKDVKFQVFFNPRQVASWRLIGYENRQLARSDFNDDHKDAGEVGAGHEVTALYEIMPVTHAVPDVDPNPFMDREQAHVAPAPEGVVADVEAAFRWRLRYKAPQGTVSQLVEFDVRDDGRQFNQASADTRWAVAVAAFAMLLRGSPDVGKLNYALVEDLAAPASWRDAEGRRSEFLQLVREIRRWYRH